ncbi:flavin reductase family protein [Mycolicibacterium pyrenivorans]|uniref:flavin reductase family protein n=1 Tax=Mycolicibacterium pyrenivorans TaxID=187102 RepID=UPI0021F28A87|nr:flavin reductase family protein [Mycolicibacterium pyrenivorans]MCV7154896.1 flavin reductase family protein [Mycolicibacterium pyrenivorans]
MTVTPESYRAALRRHPAGVAIVTLMSQAGPVGFTATSLTSLSLNPPLVCFNITHTSSSIAALRQAASVVVHIVGQHQRELAQRFSRSAEHRFNDQRSWSLLESGEPVLADTPTWLRADVQQLIPAGDSTLVIAAVTRIHCDDRDGVTPAPLVYHNGAFLATSPLPAVST